MLSTPSDSSPSRWETSLTGVVVVLCLGFNLWGVQVGWRSLNLPGHEFRQAQTALSAFHIQKDADFSIDYPTPVLGKPWSVPLEFPLYQWTVVAVSDASGLGLVQSARAVSAACFYLLLPAIFLLLGNLGVAPLRRWLVLALVLTSPLYIFYSRAFMIETMVLMFSLWFCAGFVRAVEGRSWGWLLVAVLAGTGAGLVKVTTFVLYLLPVAVWSLRHLWLRRANGVWRPDGLWMARATAIPLAAILWWAHHADATRALNPLAHFLGSEEVRPFVLGTWHDRFSPELWLLKWQTTVGSVTWWPVLVAVLGLAFFSTEKRARQSLAGIGLFALALIIFPVLYGFHDYYFMANGVLLLAALGLVLVGVAERIRWRWLPAVLALGLAGTQGWRYTEGYYPIQRGISAGGDDLTMALRDLVQADEIVVVVGSQWNPMLPYYAQRRAMMIRTEDERNPAQLDAAFAALAGEKVGALVISSYVQQPAEFLRRTEPLGISNHAIFRIKEHTVYLRADSQDRVVRQLQEKIYPGVSWVPGVEPHPDRLAGFWYWVEQLTPEKRAMFDGMKPRPVRFFSSFGPAVAVAGGRIDFGAHPVTRLVFALPAGERRLRTSVSFVPHTYAEGQEHDRKTDGVEITLTVLAKTGAGNTVYRRMVNPRDNVADRGLCELDMPFMLAEAGEVELMFGPGPAGRDTNDSILMGPVGIE